MSALPDIDLSAIPEDQRDEVAALLHETVSLKEVVKRLEHLVAELRGQDRVSDVINLQ